MMFIIFIILMVLIRFATCKMEDLLMHSIMHDDDMFDCIRDISQQNNNSRILCMFYENQYYMNRMVFKTPTVIFNKHDEIEKLKRFAKFHMFILFMTNLNQLEEFCIHMERFTIWDSRANFLFIFNDTINLTTAFEIAWKFNIYNILIMQSDSTNSTSLYTYFPYKNKNCGIKSSIYKLPDCKVKNFYPEKLSGNLGCQYKIMAIENIQPFLLNATSNRNNPNEAGLDITIMHELSKQMDVNMYYMPNKYRDWGYKIGDNYSLMFGEIQQKKVVIVFGATYANNSLMDDFDLTYCYSIQVLKWWAPAAIEIPKWRHLIVLFNPNLWCMLLVTFLLHSGVLWAITARQNEIQQHFLFSLLNSLSILFQVGIKFPHVTLIQLALLNWVLGSLLISTAYQSQLTNILTSPLYEKQLKTIDDLIESKLKLGWFHSMSSVFNKSKPRDKLLFDKYVSCPFTIDCMNRTAYKRNIATVKNEFQILYYIPRLWTRPNGKTMIKKIDDFSISIFHTIYTVKGFPLLNRMNKLLMGINENGLIYKWEGDMKFFIRKEISDDNEKTLSMSHLQTAFYILMSGHLLAAFVFVVEYCKSIRNNRNGLH